MGGGVSKKKNCCEVPRVGEDAADGTRASAKKKICAIRDGQGW